MRAEENKTGQRIREKGVILDMDGTLWDSAENVCISWNIALRERGYDRPPITVAQMQGVMGLTMDRLGAALFPDILEEERIPLLKECCRVENDYLRSHGGILYPQIEQTLRKLREHYHVSIVSNCQAGYIEAFLDHYGFAELIDDHQCYGDNGLQKAENIRLVAERNRLKEAVYVGDIQGDYEAACKAEAGFVHAAYGFGKIDHPVPAISAFSDLPAILKQVITE